MSPGRFVYVDLIACCSDIQTVFLNLTVLPFLTTYKEINS